MKDKWTIVLNDVEIECSTSRPNLKIEENEVTDEKGRKTWIAGKHTWNPIILTFDSNKLPEDSRKVLWSWTSSKMDLEKKESTNVSDLTLNYYQTNVLSESWTLKGAFPLSLTFDHEQAKMAIYFSNVEYKKADEFAFSRAFRFTVESEYFPKEFVESCEFDLIGKKITIGVYEILKKDDIPAVYSWLEVLRSQNLVVNHYDGCGNLLYKNMFYNCFLMKHYTKLNYNTTDACIHYLEFKFWEHQISI